MDVLYAWITSISSGISPLVIKATSKSLVKNPWLFNLLWVGFGIPPIAVYALIKGGSMPSDWTSIITLAVSYAIFFVLYTLAIYKIDVTTMAPLFSLRTVFATLLGVFVLNEVISPLGLVLIALIIAASPFAAYDEHQKLKAFKQPSILIAVAAMAALAAMGYFTNVAVEKNGYASTILWQDILTLAILLPTFFFIPKSDKKLNYKKIYPFVLLAVTGFAYTITATLAYASNLTLSSVIVSLPLSMIFAFVLSKKYKGFLEQHPKRVYVVRFSGAAVMVADTITLSLI